MYGGDRWFVETLTRLFLFNSVVAANLTKGLLMPSKGQRSEKKPKGRTSSVYISPDTDEVISELAERYNISRNKVMRELINHSLKQYNQIEYVEGSTLEHTLQGSNNG